LPTAGEADTGPPKYSTLVTAARSAGSFPEVNGAGAAAGGLVAAVVVDLAGGFWVAFGDDEQPLNAREPTRRVETATQTAGRDRRRTWSMSPRYVVTSA